MSDYVIIDGDTLTFEQMFGINKVTPTGPCFIAGTGDASIEGKRFCILGDEKKVSVAATYSSAAYPVNGTGQITITGLAADQVVAFATATTSVIVAGSNFTARFTVENPAAHQNNGNDPTPFTDGTGQFITSQDFVTAG
ncbi:hypothetical protein ACGVWS_01695 [Enterobacteriaceae bacterium LUAb1]